MAGNLIVTFGRTRSVRPVYVPLEDIHDARTQEIPISSDVEIGELAVLAHEDVVTLYAESACWYATGYNAVPDPVQGSNRRFLAEGASAQYSIREGTVIGVIAAA